MFFKRALASAAAILCAVVVAGSPAAAFAQEEPVNALPGTVSSVVDLKLQRDGGLSVTERITVPEGLAVHRSVPLRRSAGGATERVFGIDDARLDGNGSVEVTADELSLTLRPGFRP